MVARRQTFSILAKQSRVLTALKPQEVVRVFDSQFFGLAHQNWLELSRQMSQHDQESYGRALADRPKTQPRSNTSIFFGRFLSTLPSNRSVIGLGGDVFLRSFKLGILCCP